MKSTKLKSSLYILKSDLFRKALIQIRELKNDGLK